MHKYLSQMQSTQSTQSTQISADSVQNKGLLWATLQESGAFAGLTQDQFQPVQSAFDRVVQQSALSAMSLSDANKHIIREFMQVLRSANANNANNAIPTNVPVPKKKKIEMVYRADDLKTERANEFERQLREKQSEMDSFLTLKKPSDVSFADASVDEDKPIGDEMSRLIAQELAARERELVQLKPEDIKRAQQWIGTDNANVINATKPESPPTSSKKSVSFSAAFPDEDGGDSGENFEEEEPDILSKFKMIHEPVALESQSITLQQVHAKLLELEERMHANHAEIMAHLNSNGGVIGGAVGSLRRS